MPENKIKRLLNSVAVEKFGEEDIEKLLRVELVEKKVPISVFAQRVGCPVQALRWWTEKYKIDYRKKNFSVSDLEEIGYRGWDDFFKRNQGTTFTKMSKELGCNVLTVKRYYASWIAEKKG